MNNYEYLSKNINIVNRLVNNGLIPMTIYRDLEIYERFLAKTGLKEERYKEIAEEMGISVRTVKRGISTLNKRIK